MDLREGLKRQEWVLFLPVFMSQTPCNSGFCLKIAKQASCSGSAEKVSACWTQKSRSKDHECVAVSQSQFAKLPLGSASMVAKIEEKKTEKEIKER